MQRFAKLYENNEYGTNENQNMVSTKNAIWFN